MTPQGKLLFEACRDVRNAGKTTLGVSCHPSMVAEIEKALVSAQIDLPVHPDPRADLSGFAIITDKMVTTEETTASLPDPDKDELFYNCPWCGAVNELNASDYSHHGIVDGCARCGLGVDIVFKVTVDVVKRSESVSAEDAFNAGRRISAE